MESGDANANMGERVADLVWCRALVVVVAAHQALACRVVTIGKPATFYAVPTTIPWVHAHPGFTEIACGARPRTVTAVTRIGLSVHAFNVASVESRNTDAVVDVCVASLVVYIALLVICASGHALAAGFVAIGEAGAPNLIHAAVPRILTHGQVANVGAGTRRVAVAAVTWVGLGVHTVGTADRKRW